MTLLLLARSSAAPTPAAQTIATAYAVSGAVAYGAQVSQPGTTVPALAVRAFSRAALGTELVDLDQSFARSFQDTLNETGTGTVTLDMDDPDLALIDDDTALRFEIHGYAALTVLVREREYGLVAEDEEHGEVVMLSGPGHLAVLDEARVYPARGVDVLPVQEDRPFNWSAVDYDDSAWIAATEIVTQSSSANWWYDGAGNHLPNTVDDPAKWPDPNAAWIWARSGSEEWAPEGTCYVRKTFTATGPKLWLIFTVDDAGQLYIDGQKVLDTDNQGNGPTDVRTILIDCTPGTHTLAVAATNAPDPEGDGLHNPAGVLLTAYPADATGVITSYTPDVHTDSSWKIVEYPPVPPGMTAGEVIRHAVEEAQARGCFPLLTLAFDDEVDSDGVPWAEVTDIATKVGTDLLAFVREIAAIYADVWMAPGSWTLHAWVRDGRGTDTAVSFHRPTDPTDPTSGNLTALVTKRVI